MFEVRDKPQMVEKALLVGICFDKREEEESLSLLSELKELVGTLGIGVVERELVRTRDEFFRPDRVYSEWVSNWRRDTGEKVDCRTGMRRYKECGCGRRRAQREHWIVLVG